MSTIATLEKRNRATRAGPRATARGTVKIALSMGVAAVAGLVLHVYLARALQPELYGIVAVVTSVIVWWEAATGALVRQATERMVAGAGEAWRGVAGSSVRTALATSIVVAAASFAVAPLIGSALEDPRLTGYIRLMSLDIPLWVLWVAWTAVLNGQRHYGRRALSTAAYWAGKAVLICGLVALGWSVTGAIIGSICASIVGLVVAWALAGVRLPRPSLPTRELMLFGLPLMALAIADRLMLSMDLWFVKALVPSPEAAGLYGVGKYAFQAAIMVPAAVCGAAFPTLTRAVESANRASIRELIQQSSRFVLLLIAPMMAIMACCGQEIISLVFGEAYAASSTAVAILVAAALLFGLRLVGDTALIAAGRPRLVLAALAPLVPINIALNYVLVPSYGLVGGAVATISTLFVGACLMWWLTWREFRVAPRATSAIRATAAAAMVFGVGVLVPGEGCLVLAKMALLLAIYALTLGAIGELRLRDLEPLVFWRGTGARGPAEGADEDQVELGPGADAEPSQSSEHKRETERRIVTHG